jgi:hypothetical protein
VKPFLCIFELSKLEDSRGKQGKRYQLALLLTCVLLAKMAGETTRHSIAEWIRLRSIWLQEVLPETRAAFPCAATYSNVLRTEDPAQVNQVLKEDMIAEKANELTHMKPFLTPVLLQGRIISADALSTRRSFYQDMIATGADYLLLVKHNQPTFYEDLSLFFHAPLVIVSIGAPPASAPKDMDGWKPICCGPRLNSMTFWRATGMAWDTSSAYAAVWNMPLDVHRQSCMASPA